MSETRSLQKISLILMFKILDFRYRIYDASEQFYSRSSNFILSGFAVLNQIDRPIVSFYNSLRSCTTKNIVIYKIFLFGRFTYVLHKLTEDV